MNAEIEKRHVRIHADGVALDGDLALPAGGTGLVVFAHGSGSSRHSARNRQVATALQQGGLGTLLMDLLTAEEEQVDALTTHLRFDIPFLAERLLAACDWLADDPATATLDTGLFGASTGGGAALVAAARRPEHIHAVVSRGGRPDLAAAALPCVRAPTLLIVGGEDAPVLDLNREAMTHLTAPVQLEIVAGATHLFSEPGALEQVAVLARDWFLRHLVHAPAAGTRR